MAKWMGLFKKEWAFMKWKVIALVLTNAGLAILSVSHIFYAVPNDFTLGGQLFSEMWVLIHLVIGILLLFQSLGREMKHTDIWLHTPASIWQLVGVKGFFAAFAVMCSLIVCGIIIGISYFVGGGTVAILDGSILLFGVVAAILLNSINIMALGFLFWSIYQVVNSRIGWLSIFVTIGLFYAWAYLWALLYFSEWFSTIKEMGPIQITGTVTLFESNLVFENNYIFWGLVPEGALLSAGSFLLYVVLTAIYFVSGSMLFEKKVRL